MSESRSQLAQRLGKPQQGYDEDSKKADKLDRTGEFSECGNS